MNIVVYGTAGDFQECRDKFGDGHHYFAGLEEEALPHDQTDTVAFIFNTDGLLPARLFHVKKLVAIFVDAASVPLSDILKRNKYQHPVSVFGFAGMPGFLNRPILEISKPDTAGEELLAKICGELNTAYLLVKDQVGMITPRVICMIINEAYYAVSEKTASRADIDKAMRTGTNYPMGPFEWSKKIGLGHVYHLLTALQAAGDKRYQISPLLKDDYMLEQQNSFLH